MKFRSKSKIVEAVQWDGFSISSIRNFAKGWKVKYDFDSESIELRSKFGVIRMGKGEWLVKKEGMTDIDNICQDSLFNEMYVPIVEVKQGDSNGFNDYQGITYAPNGKYDCKKGMHKLDEVWNTDEHYLVCDDCQLMIHISKIDKTYLKKIGKKK